MQLSELDWAYARERAAHFTGRSWVFARLDQFLDGPPGVFLLLGEPGTGKTAVAAQLALAADGRLTHAEAAVLRRPVPIAAAYFCRARQVDVLDVAQRMSDQLAEAVAGFEDARRGTLAPEIRVGDVHVRTGDVAAGGSVTGVRIDLSRLGVKDGGETAFRRSVTLPLKRVREAGETTRIVLLVDALDESLASEAADALPRLLGEVEYVHVVVTSRRDHRAIGWLGDRAELMDVLADAPPGTDDVLEYLQHRLMPEGAASAMAVLARRIAEHAGGNFLYAFYVVEALLSAQALGDLDDAAAWAMPLPEGGLPGVYRDFLRRELWRDDRGWSRRFRPVLASLAVARDEGLTTEQLRLVAGRLGEAPMTRTAIREVTRTARQFLEGPGPDGPFRIYHQSFVNFLVDSAQNADFLIDAAETHDAIVAAYASTDPLRWDRYPRRNLALHASEVGQLDRLLEDARFLLVADPSRLVPHLDAARSVPARAAAAVYRQSAHQLASADHLARASQLELTAHRLGYPGLAAAIASAAPGRPWRTWWSHGRRAAGHQVVAGHDGGVTAVATCVLADGTAVIVSGGNDGTVRVWRLADLTPVGEPLHAQSGMVAAVAVAALPDRTPVIVSGGSDGSVRVWRLADLTPVGVPLRGHDYRVTAVAAAALPDGTPVIISGGNDGTVRVWRTVDGTPVGEPMRGPVASWNVRVNAVTAATLADGIPVIISASDDDTIRVWRLGDLTPVGSPLRYAGRTVAAGKLPDGTPVIISSSADGRGHGTVLVWRPADEVQVSEPLRSLEASWLVRVNAVAAGVLPDGTPVIISGGSDGTVRVWRLADLTPVGEPLAGHDGEVTAVTAGMLPDGTPIIISGGSDGTVRVWRTTDLFPVGEPLAGHERKISGMAAGVLPDGIPVIVARDDAMVRVWRTADGSPAGEPLRVPGGVNAVAAGVLPDGTLVTITAGGDRAVRVWRTADGSPVAGVGGWDRAPTVDALAVGVLPDDTPVIITGSGSSGKVQVRRLADLGWVGEMQATDNEYRIHAVHAVAAAVLPDGNPVIISSGNDDMVRVWRLGDLAPVGKPLRADFSRTFFPEIAVAAGMLPDGTPVVISGGREGNVRVWRLPGLVPVSEPLRAHDGHAVNAVAAGMLRDGRPIIITGGADGTVRVWQTADLTQVVPPLRLLEPVRAIAVQGTVIITAAGFNIAAHEIALFQPPVTSHQAGITGKTRPGGTIGPTWMAN
jgi:WD40 repeat protein